MVEYVDLQCPYCQQFETAAMPPLISRYVRTGKVKVEARTLAFIGPDSQRGRDAALAAADQNKLFNFIQLLYLNQGAPRTAAGSTTR
jgi:protein-disulfide isomerase